MKISTTFNLSSFFLLLILGGPCDNILYADLSMRAEKVDKKENRKEDFVNAMEDTANAAKKQFESSYQTFTDEFKSGKQKIEAGAKKLGEKLGLTSDTEVKSEHSTVSIYLATKDKTIRLQVQTYQQSSTFIIHVINKNQEETLEEEHNSLAELKQLKNYIRKSFQRDFNSKIALTILDQCIQAIGLKQKDKDVNVESSNKNHHQKYIIETTPHHKAKDNKKESTLSSIFSFS